LLTFYVHSIMDRLVFTFFDLISYNFLAGNLELTLGTFLITGFMVSFVFPR